MKDIFWHFLFFFVEKINGISKILVSIFSYSTFEDSIPENLNEILDNEEAFVNIDKVITDDRPEILDNITTNV